MKLSKKSYEFVGPVCESTDTFAIIKRYQKLLVKNHKYVFLGAWNFKEEIFQKEKKFIKSGGKFITHIPYPRVI